MHEARAHLMHKESIYMAGIVGDVSMHSYDFVQNTEKTADFKSKRPGGLRDQCQLNYVIRGIHGALLKFFLLSYTYMHMEQMAAVYCFYDDVFTTPSGGDLITKKNTIKNATSSN
jgi:hypothetical protein